jgi:predicted nucleic acid-binding protein
MIAVDTSVWVHHLKVGDSRLASLLAAGVVLVHPFTEGELALGGADVARVLGGVPRLVESPHGDVLRFVERQGGALRGIGWVDAHIAHAALAGGHDLFTHDRRQSAFFTGARW